MANNTSPHTTTRATNLPICSFSFCLQRGSAWKMACFFWGLAIFSTGCSSEPELNRIEVSGRVDRDGAEIESGSISFLPAEGETGPAANGPITDGRYSFSTKNGPMPGRYKVLVDIAQGSKGAAMKEGKGIQTHWEFEVVVPEEGPFEKDFTLNSVNKRNQKKR